MPNGNIRCRMGVMNSERKRAFLERLWDLQTEAGLSDAALARELGVRQSAICRAKQAIDRTFGLDFAMRAGDRFPELRALLFTESPIGINCVPTREDERAS